MKTRFLAICMAGLLVLTSGCGSAKSSASGAGSMASGSAIAAYPEGDSYREEVGQGFDMPMPEMPKAEEGAENSIYQNSGAKLIRTAELSIQSTQFDQARQQLEGLVRDHGGYYETATEYGGSDLDSRSNRRGEYVIRVPAEEFDAFRTGAGLIGHIVSSTQSSEDVGERYYDTEMHLKTQRTKQERLLGLLEKAATMEDIIALENALSEVEYQIEQLSSTLNRYDALIGFATIRVYLNEVVKVSEPVGETASLGQKIAAGFAASWDGLVSGMQNMLVWISYHIVFVLVLGTIVAGGAVFAVRMIKREKKAPAKKEEQD